MNEKTQPIQKGEKSQLVSKLYSIGLPLVLAAAVFIATYFVLTSFVGQKQVIVNGLRVYFNGVDPQGQFASAIGGPVVTMQIAVQNEADIVAAPQLAAAEMAWAIGASGRNVTVEGYVANGDYCVDANKTRIACIKPAVILRRGDCNCVRVEKDDVAVEGNDAWFSANSARMRGVFQWGLNSQTKVN